MTTIVPPFAPFSSTARCSASWARYWTSRSRVVTSVRPRIAGSTTSIPLAIGNPSADNSTVRVPGEPARTSWYSNSRPASPVASTPTKPSTCGASAPAG